MPLLDPSHSPIDRDGDTIMSGTSISQLNLLKDKFNFDWFTFDNKVISPKSPTLSSPTSTLARNLSSSTASPTGYFTQSPISSGPSYRHALQLGASARIQVNYPAPPTKPLKWVWQCHLCHSRYPLAVTRRCLVDGHYYCSGNSQTQRNVKKRRRNQSCTSEFDYVGWKEWGQWKRKTLALRALADEKPQPRLLGCEGCASPSQCRYDKREPVEEIKFDDFIQAEDLVIHSGQTVSSIKSSFERQSKSSAHNPTKPSDEEKDTNSKKPVLKKSLKTDLGLSSKYHRFYSGLSANLSTRDLSPTSDSTSSLDRGKFDPTLPSVPRSSAKGDDDLIKIGSTLKAVLASQKQTLSPPRSNTDFVQLTPQPERRTNSKIDDPRFEITPEEIEAALGPGAGMPLQRTRSQQQLLTDFFRQTRSMTRDDQNQRNTGLRAASEADIAAFLQSKPSHDLSGNKSRT